MVATPWDAGGPELVGRDGDLAQLTEVINGVCAGKARTVIVSGDAGVGKTALVRRACASAPPDALMLIGGALPLASVDVPFLALRSAFRTAAARVVGTLPAPELSGDARPDVLVQIDEWLTAQSRLRPVILVIDDLHWADQSTLDVLMYILAGPGDRPLGVIGTVRTGEVRPGGALHQWLADIRRLPRMDVHRLGPLDRPDTEAQLSQLLGAPPHQSLINDVYTRSAGNPYLNLLLVEGLTAGARHLPAGFPPDLKSAVLRAWRGLSAGARELTQILALGGRAASAAELRAVAGSAVEPDGVLPLLHLAVEAGLVDLAPDGTYWFHHPIIAEALEQGLDAGERRRWHAAFAAVYERQLDDGARPDAAVAVSLADHYDAAGRPADAYRWALTAADLASANGALSDALRLLRRTVQLRAALPDAVEQPRDLWDRLRAAARESGAMAQELEAIEILLACIDKAEEPLEASHLMVRRMHLQLSTGQAFFPMADIREAVRLSAATPRRWEHALALAELVHASMWHSEPGADALAYQALALARETGDQRALSYALTAAAIVANTAHRFTESRDLAAKGAVEAVRARDFWAYVHATYWTGNAQDPWTSAEYADLLCRARQELMEQGAPHAYISKIAATEAASYLAVGAWRECRAALRIALSLDPGPMGDVDARLTAARLAQLQGRHDEAAVHLARADELYQENSGYLNLTFDAIRAEVHVAAGRPELAFTAAMAGATGPGPAPTMCEWLLPLAARALADQAQRARDLGDPTAELLVAAKELEQRFPGVLHERVGHAALYNRQVAAFELLYTAELGRVRNEPGSAAAWARTADAFGAALLPWEEAYACRRAVELLLLQGHHRSPRAAEFLRRGLTLATDLEAVPIRVALERLAAHARIPVAPVTATPLTLAARLPGLTPRERDILEFVVAGRTYGEIARGLMISEKTVSSHISNLLRKTGAANRVDLARLASGAGPVSNGSA
ncbi:AAA family ATPase [Pseudarthrobacter psychrotolerans]|uniref:AAA family ATPase n=1 Tax=Pseudarthrobacter psychrotolerans TaxID=2697569 RepID=A0A6P1NI77_9MICC|nr:LuxR family transcriptional regulator [Pseudarthrobacter psychrotolerans]QHK19058.1 AAA family ATPase [Pseudarthrobacter psychrotolerans]